MGRELVFDHAVLSGAGRHMKDSAALFRRHADSLLLTVGGSGGAAWGGTALGAAVDQLNDLVQHACGTMHGNLHATGSAIEAMADDLRGRMAAAEDAVDAIRPEEP
ncbi:hypothetical protein ABT294_31955 [Nonomuraea sp. NPDC000554]|uniref:hypothetical protein n=1 Tax=Nonomuraea sp. NPDC000554 TaxID=3154259 RepID=UPI0033208E13